MEDKDEEAEIPENVFKGLVRKNGPVEAGNEVETAGSDRVGLVYLLSINQNTKMNSKHWHLKPPQASNDLFIIGIV